MKNLILLIILTWITVYSAVSQQSQVNLTKQSTFNVSILSDCNSDLNLNKKSEIIIKRRSDYQDLEKLIKGNSSPNPNCMAAQLPYIDFNNYVLVGKKTNELPVANGQSVIADFDNKKVIYRIILQKSGRKGPVVSCWNWAIIPKFTDDFTIEVQTE